MALRTIKIVEEEFESHLYHLRRGTWDSSEAMLTGLKNSITKRIEAECIEQDDPEEDTHAS